MTLLTGPAGMAAVPVVCAIIGRNGLFLAAKRGPGRTNAGLWEFPGGKVRQGETENEALCRELREELSIDVVCTGRLAPSVFTYPWITIRLIPFLCGIVQGEPAALEHSCLQWITVEDAASLSWAPADLPVLESYREYLRKK